MRNFITVVAGIFIGICLWINIMIFMRWLDKEPPTCEPVYAQDGINQVVIGTHCYEQWPDEW